MAIKVGQIELTAPLEAIQETASYDSVRLLVRHEGRPLGWLSVENSDHGECLSEETVRAGLADQFRWDTARQVLGERFHPGRLVAEAPRLSVVVCTRGSMAGLSVCLKSLLQQDQPACEIIVVDSSPPNEAASTLAADLSVRYAREERPGLAWARNRGVLEATGDVVAFVDDDVRPDPRWLRTIAQAFVDPDVAVVIGSAAPVELETTEQTLFECSLAGWPQDLRRRTVRRRDLARGEALALLCYSVGTSMAFRRSVFGEAPSFDPAMDVAPALGGSCDLEMCHRLVAAGRTLVFEPAALVWYSPERTRPELARQLFTRGLEFGAFVVAAIRNRESDRSAIARFAVKEWFWRAMLKRLLRPGLVPRRLVWAELRGALQSPLAYRAARRKARVPQATATTSA